jgi:hypothetical protein
VLGRAQLTVPLSGIDTSVHTQGAWSEVRHYGITTLGGVLFDAWDCVRARPHARRWTVRAQWGSVVAVESE